MEADITRHEFFVRGRMLLDAGTRREIIPVVKADGRSIGNGKAGDVITATHNGAGSVNDARDGYGRFFV